MPTKSEIKFITGLHLKKYRDQERLFLAEGPKVIGEFLDAGFSMHSFFATDPLKISGKEASLISKKDLGRISKLKTPNNCIAVFEMRAPAAIQNSGLIVALDAVRDPGNLGTIIRLCDWFGVRDLVCSEDTADCYNPKVVQSAMGSLARVSVHYVKLEAFLNERDAPICGAVMDGKDVYSEDLPQDAVLLLGNESHGISKDIDSLLDRRLTIPRFGVLQKTESLNVATAAAILLSEFRRSTGR